MKLEAAMALADTYSFILGADVILQNFDECHFGMTMACAFLGNAKALLRRSAWPLRMASVAFHAAFCPDTCA